MADNGSILGELGSDLKEGVKFAMPLALGAAMGGPLGALAGYGVEQGGEAKYKLEEGPKQFDELLKLRQLNREDLADKGQQALMNDEGFQKFMGQTLGVGPDTIKQMKGIPLTDLHQMLDTAAKLKAAKGSRIGPLQMPDGRWVMMDAQTGETIPMPGKPERAAVSETSAKEADARSARSSAEATARTMASIAAGHENTAAIISGENARADKSDALRRELAATPKPPSAPKAWTPMDAFNAKTKAIANAKAMMSHPGLLHASVPPSPEEMKHYVTNEALKGGLNPDSFMPLKSGDKVTLPNGRTVTWKP